MQTFLPYPSFAESLRILDYRRLGKQRVEAGQLINLLEKLKTAPGEKLPWMNHPARIMWANHLDALKYYYNVSIFTWIARGYRNTMPLRDFYRGGQLYKCSELSLCPQLAEETLAKLIADCEETVAKPSFIGDRKFHRSHQSNLIRKFPEYYRPLFPRVPANLPYLWPAPNDNHRASS